MYRYRDVYLKTKFDVEENIIVFTSGKTLNERFTELHDSHRVFILNNGYTARFKDNCITGRVAFQNQRSIDLHKRFKEDERSNLKSIQKQVFGKEDKNLSKSKLAEIGSNRRTVLKSRELNDDEPTKYCNEESMKSTVQSSNYYVNSSSYVDVNTPKSSKSCKFLDIEQSSESENKFRKSASFDKGPVKRTWNGRVKRQDNSHIEDSEGSEPIIYSPFPSYRSNHYVRPSLYKWRRGPTSKEKLDEELDRYMAEAKYKAPPVLPVKDDVDAFIKEYMLETEKCLNESSDIYIE